MIVAILVFFVAEYLDKGTHQADSLSDRAEYKNEASIIATPIDRIENFDEAQLP